MAPSPAQRASAKLAVGFGVFLAFAEVVRNWGDWGFWPFWVVDYIAVALLLAGARGTLRGEPTAQSPLLPGAWGFTCAMFYGSFFGHVAALRENATAADHGPIEHARLTWTIGVLFALTVVGFALSLIRARAAPRESGEPG